MEEWVITDGKVVDYFKGVESTILCLNYPRDSEMMMAKLSQDRTHFIGKTWGSLNKMKVEVIPYDMAHWEINNTKNTSEHSRT